MRLEAKLFIFAVLLMMVVAVVDAKPTAPTGAGALTINTWDITHIPLNSNYTFVWDVADANGLLLYNNQTQCSFFLIEAGTIGQRYGGLASRTPDRFGWYQPIIYNNFSTLNDYNYQIDCSLLSNTSISGNSLGTLTVTPNGQSLDVAYTIAYALAIMFMVALVLMLLYGMIASTGYVAKASFFLFAYLFGIFTLFSVYTFIYDYFLSLTIIGNLFYYLFITSLIAFVPILFVGIGTIVYHTIYKGYLDKMMEQGLPELDAERVAKSSTRRRFGMRR